MFSLCVTFNYYCWDYLVNICLSIEEMLAAVCIIWLCQFYLLLNFLKLNYFLLPTHIIKCTFHFLFVIDFRIFVSFDCCCQSLFFLHASQSESCWWGVLVVAPWAVIILTQHVDDITWLSPIPLTKLPSSERYNHPADLPDFLVKDVNIIIRAVLMIKVIFLSM